MTSEKEKITIYKQGYGRAKDIKESRNICITEYNLLQATRS